MLDQFSSPEQNKACREMFTALFNIATLPFYWSDLEPEQGRPRFAKDSPNIYRRPAIDLCLEYCEANGIEPKAHCLNYASFTPSWARGTIEWEKQCLRKRFEELTARYADRIPMWEVANETFWASWFYPTNFYHQPDFIEWSFKEAERCFPANRLVINEANCRIWDDNFFFRTRSPYFMQIENALLKGCRIDEIGMQFHMFAKREDELRENRSCYDPERIYDVLDTYAYLGKPLHISELTETGRHDGRRKLLLRRSSPSRFHPETILPSHSRPLPKGMAYRNGIGLRRRFKSVFPRILRKIRCGNNSERQNRLQGISFQQRLQPRP